MHHYAETCNPAGKRRKQQILFASPTIELATDFVEPKPSLRIQLQSKVVELMRGRIGEGCDEGRRLMAGKVRHEYKLGDCQPIKVTPSLRPMNVTIILFKT